VTHNRAAKSGSRQGGDFVIAGGNAPALPDIVEESLDQIARPVEPGTPNGLFLKCPLTGHVADI
jgi:hypothetical protein